MLTHITTSTLPWSFIIYAYWAPDMLQAIVIVRPDTYPTLEEEAYAINEVVTELRRSIAIDPTRAQRSARWSVSDRSQENDHQPGDGGEGAAEMVLDARPSR